MGQRLGFLGSKHWAAVGETKASDVPVCQSLLITLTGDLTEAAPGLKDLFRLRD